MTRFNTRIVFVLLVVLAAPAAKAQVFGPGGYGFGPYGGFGQYGGYGGNWGYGALPGYGQFNYSQQVFQQQAALTQQIFQQRQQMILGQVQQAKGRLQGLDTIKQQMFVKYLDMNDTDKTAVRSRLMSDYLALDDQGKESWKRDGVVQSILGADLPRLDSVSKISNLSDTQKLQLRDDTLKKYRALSPAEQTAWRSDPILNIIMGKNWWLE